MNFFVVITLRFKSPGSIDPTLKPSEKPRTLGGTSIDDTSTKLTGPPCLT